MGGRGVGEVSRGQRVDVDDLPAGPPVEQGRGEPGLLLQGRVAGFGRGLPGHRVELPEDTGPAADRQVVQVVQREVRDASRHRRPLGQPSREQVSPPDRVRRSGNRRRAGGRLARAGRQAPDPCRQVACPVQRHPACTGSTRVDRQTDMLVRRHTVPPTSCSVEGSIHRTSPRRQHGKVDMSADRCVGTRSRFVGVSPASPVTAAPRLPDQARHDGTRGAGVAVSRRIQSGPPGSGPPGPSPRRSARGRPATRTPRRSGPWTGRGRPAPGSRTGLRAGPPGRPAWGRRGRFVVRVVAVAGASSPPRATISSTVRTDRPSATMRCASRSWPAASSSPSSARACPAESTPAATRRWTSGGSLSSRRVFEICGRERPIRPASSSCVQPKSWSSWS